MSYQPQPVVVVQAPETNGLGTAGFIVSLISFFLCGLTSPVGLLMSGLALFKRPRGMAIAGTILGFLGSAWLFIGGFALLGSVVALLFGASEASRVMEEQRAKSGASAPAIAPSLELPEPAEPSVVEVSPPQPVVEVTPGPVTIEPSVPLPEPAPALRTWTSADGKFTVEAEFVSMTAGVVKLQRADGSAVNVPLDKLSESDRAWIEAKR